MPAQEEPISLKKFIKVWSQAGATLVVAVIALALGFNWIHWTQEQIALVMGVYAAVMIMLRQLFSVTEDPIPYAGDIVIEPDPEGGRTARLEITDGPDELLHNTKLQFHVKISDTW